MKNYRKSLPPLDSLLFFHAAARNNSLTVAANELFVTQAAVSKRLQRLETWLGTSLFSRAGRNLELTEAGTLLASDVEMALEFLDQAISKAKAPGHSAVRIAASSALSMFWLYERLKAFSLSDAACEVSVITTDSTTELLSEAHDLAIVYCDGALPGWDCVSIVDVEMVPAAAPDVAELAHRCGMFSDEGPNGEAAAAASVAAAGAAAPPLLGYSSLTPDWINWENWLSDLGLAKMQSRPMLHCSSYVQSIGKALEGRGVALINAVVMKDELTSGKLVRIGSNSLKPQKSYHLCRRKNANPSQNVAELFAFLNT